jgi:hypothetical protein
LLQLNGGFGTHFDPSRGAPRKRAIRPIETSKSVFCDVRSTSTPAVAKSGHPLRRGERINPSAQSHRR